MTETVLFMFVAMLADVVVTVPMITVGAIIPPRRMLAVAVVGALAVSIAMGNAASGDHFVAQLVARALAMTFAGLIGTVIYRHRMAKKSRRIQAQALTSSTEIL